MYKRMVAAGPFGFSYLNKSVDFGNFKAFTFTCRLECGRQAIYPKACSKLQWRYQSHFFKWHYYVKAAYFTQPLEVTSIVSMHVIIIIFAPLQNCINLLCLLFYYVASMKIELRDVTIMGLPLLHTLQPYYTYQIVTVCNLYVWLWDKGHLFCFIMERSIMESKTTTTREIEEERTLYRLCFTTTT